ncbi:hypothetical protein GCM10009630_60790 [Kribbella jejuensis]|uniref:Uncharacterized protein n=1 Tax=Kribbella jejuensis TaxID=236068 RepID=A0A542EPC2_9ACTN|nr:hypothetical protein [Kribbella jejuensis]TQJ17197.1 hypothetical protein FB475_1311 [Kribbella jejuensis]
MVEQVLPNDATPPPALVAAWLTLDNLHLEAVPMWAANWIVQGYDGPSLAELAGLNGQDTREVRDLLPDALADTGIAALPSGQAALKIAYDDIATAYLAGRAQWTWAANEVARLVIATNYAEENFDHPLSVLWYIDEEIGQPWARTDDELAADVRRLCIDQLHH